MFNKNNVKLLQEELKKKNLKAYLVFTSDAHDNEYVGKKYLLERLFFSPFSGSAGQVLITQNDAYLFTDGRYWLQAEKELKGSGIKLIKDGDKDVPSLKDFIKENNLYPLGVNLKNISESKYEAFLKSGIQISDASFEYLIDEKLSEEVRKVFKLNDDLVSLNYKEKISIILKEAAKSGARANLVSTLDDIAFILNLRGGDIPRNPVFYSYLYLSKIAGNHLFIDKNKIDFELDDITIHPYEDIFGFLKKHKDIKTLVDPNRVNAKAFKLLNQPLKGRNPSYLMKAIKGEKEILNTKKIQALDGLALLKFQKYLEENIDKNLSEYDYSSKLEEFRKECTLCFDLSFDTIAAVGKNAAMMHYEPTKSNNSVVSKDDIELLVDSGGQYYGGTTDTTRTFLIGNPTKEFIHDYTLTLKALIAVSSTIFLEGSSGQTIDIKAREFFWKEGMDYKCGTGHGVGYILNVHEGPNGFRYKKVPERDDQDPLKEGMITTIEPGVYKQDKYGIRIENNLLCKKAFENDQGRFFKFETITYAPIETMCLDLNMMSDEEIDWLNDYHKMVYDTLSKLTKDEELLKFLRTKTKAINKK